MRVYYSCIDEVKKKPIPPFFGLSVNLTGLFILVEFTYAIHVFIIFAQYYRT